MEIALLLRGDTNIALSQENGGRFGMNGQIKWQPWSCLWKTMAQLGRKGLDKTVDQIS